MIKNIKGKIVFALFFVHFLHWYLVEIGGRVNIIAGWDAKRLFVT